MDLNVFDMFLAIEIIFIIDAPIFLSFGLSVWLLNHVGIVTVGFDSFLLVIVIFTLIIYISGTKLESVISLRSPASF